MQKMIEGDALEILRKLPANSVDSIVTDPPYGLSDPPLGLALVRILLAWIFDRPLLRKGKGFMDKEWDAQVPSPEIWRECLRVLKPGGHLLCFAGSRTVDLTGMAVRLAGFEIRDQLQWLYGSGFPKSLDVSKALDKEAGASAQKIASRAVAADKRTAGGRAALAAGLPFYEVPITAPATEAAKQWDGWGTALKPAHEPIIMARKPLSGTVAANVRAHCTGGINVDGCRVEAEDPDALQAKYASTRNAGPRANSVYASDSRNRKDGNLDAHPLGRWPANVVMDETAGALLDAQAGNRPGMSGGGKHKRPKTCSECHFEPATFHCHYCGRRPSIAGGGHDCPQRRPADDGGPSRFFYCPKASRAEREAGLEDFELQRRTDGREKDIDNPRLRTSERRNTHPTVKPIALMQWLVRLVTPPGGLVLDPFAGSGTTGIACKREGFRFLGIEMSAEYVEIARARIAAEEKP